MQNTQRTLLNIRQLTERLSLSKSAIYRRLDSKDKLHDPSFPKPIKMGETTSRWIESEVDDWIENLIFKQRHSA
ncbi:MAG: AlpA family phage regulatory protein [Pseudomonadota bacterium]|nr:AlpA family phage regulatory protein [Pseudomonadota bacterium]